MTKALSRLVLTMLGLFASRTVTLAENIELQPKGVYATIDQSKTIEAIGGLRSEDPQVRDTWIHTVIADPGNYNPKVFYVLSSVLIDSEDKDGAMFWYYFGQLRARIDANICADASARSQVGVLNRQFGEPITRFAVAHPERMRQTINAAAKKEAETDCRYDRRWINLHGMNAVLSGLGSGDDKPLSLPKEQWEAVRTKTRERYLAGANRAIDQLMHTQK